MPATAQQSASVPAAAVAAQSPDAINYGQVIEYIQDRLYLASYTHAPNEKTPFPYLQKSSKSPNKRSSRAQLGPTPAASEQKVKPHVYFSVDTTLLYNAFHHDFGPLHMGHVYRFAVILHDVLGAKENEDKAIVFWTFADARCRANAACILACYMVLIQHWPPHLALAPIAQMDPPCMPFRDAGYSQADYTITIQDVVYGVWKAKEEGLCALNDFSLEEYETFERVDQGDFNWLTPSFLAFASPQHPPKHPIPPVAIPPTDPRYKELPTTIPDVQKSKLPTPFKNVLSHFKTRNIGLVVRLNSELYSPTYFTALGIQHLDMIFDDGTCPPLHLVRRFIQLAHHMINVRGKGIAVHCKAGLGRTGCLIGAYLIYRHGFTANECIAFMRFMRPGMVVGPQQHWLHINQGVFREWWHEEQYKAKFAAPSTPTKTSPSKSRDRVASNGQTFTPPNGSSKRAALGDITSATSPDKPKAHYTSIQDENLPAPTPGQPRKTSKAYGSPRRQGTEPFDIHPDTEIVSMQRHTQGESESEEEFQLRMLARNRAHASRSPGSSPAHKRRAVSCTTTTTHVRSTSTSAKVYNDESDIENAIAAVVGGDAKTKTPRTADGSRERSGKGDLSMAKMRDRSSPIRRSTEGKTPGGVRKTSGRVGSAGAIARGA